MLILSHYYHLCLIIAGSSFIGLIAGVLGTFVYLRKQSLLGDTVSHAALPGIVLALILTSNTSPTILLCGGALSGALGILFSEIIKRVCKLHSDTILGIILSVFFGMGLVLISILQKYPRADQAVLNKFLFGNISILLLSDLFPIIVIGSFVFIGITLFWKEFKMYSFDPEFSSTIPYVASYTNYLFLILLLMVISICLQCVGVILMSSLLIAPAVSARQWTLRVKTMMIVAAIFGSSVATLGTLVSNQIQTPTGPTIVIILSILVAISLLFAPARGILTPFIKNYFKRERLP
ncbi:MAG: metal ABC transporter permease [Candidatus Dependentiae bacterium]|nr:metal ABC transporter permease [Candidatus Dependentiae bacterium]